MSDPKKVQATFEAFMTNFVAPLLHGHVARVDRPIGPGVMPHFELAKLSDTHVEESIEAGLTARALAFAPRIYVHALDRDALALCLAGYNLAAMADSSLQVWPATRARPVLAHWVHRLINSVGLPRTEAAAVVRHIVVSRMLELWRRDVVMSNWGTSRTYRGREAPKTPTLPPVGFERLESKLTFSQLLESLPGELQVPSALRTMLAASPITEILLCQGLGELRLSVAALGVLSSLRIRGAIARELAGGDLKQLSLVLWNLLASARTASPPALAPFVALIIETQLLFLAGAFDRPLTIDSDGEARFWGLFSLVVGAMPTGPRVLDLGSRDASVVLDHAARLAQQIPATVIQEVRTVVAPILSTTPLTTLLEIRS